MTPADHRPLRGALLMLCASVLISLSTLFAKTLGTGPDAMSPIQVTWGRFAFGLMGVVLIGLLIKPQLSPASWPRHAARVACGWMGVTAMFASIALIPLGDATAISFTNPIFAMIFAIPLLGERIGRIRWLTAILALIGALLLIRPGTSSFQPAALIAVGAAVLLGMEIVMLKMISRDEPTYQIILIANVAGAVLSSILMLWFWQSPTGTQWVFLAGTGLAMVVAQAFFTSSLKQSDASFVVPFSYTTLIFATIYDVTLFDIVPTYLSLMGGAIIILSGLILAWREGVARNR